MIRPECGDCGHDIDAHDLNNDDACTLCACEACMYVATNAPQLKFEVEPRGGGQHR
jgi:hypothetical protein